MRAVVLTGAGDAFSAGGDTKFLLEIPSMEPDRLREVVYATFQRPIRAIRSMEKPVGAGCELAVASDFRLASERARFGEVWVKIGCVPALGGMYLLPRIVGLTKATEMILTGEIVDARRRTASASSTAWSRAIGSWTRRSSSRPCWRVAPPASWPRPRRPSTAASHPTSGPSSTRP